MKPYHSEIMTLQFKYHLVLCFMLAVMVSVSKAEPFPLGLSNSDETKDSDHISGEVCNTFYSIDEIRV